MNTENEIKSRITKGDIFLIVITAVFSLFLFLLPFLSSEEKLGVRIYLEGETVYSKAFSELAHEETVKVGGCEILIERDGATFLHSECEDKLCVKRGKLSLEGDTMACVPERVAVVIFGGKEKDFDGISY